MDRPPTKLSLEKKEKGEITKKINQKRNRSQQEKLLSQNKATPSTSQTHIQKSIQPQGFKQKSGVAV